MRKITIIILLLLGLFPVSGQDLSKEQQVSVATFIDCIRLENKKKLARKISFPLYREYPIPSIKNSKDFLLRYHEVFDDKLTNMIVNSKPANDWSTVGWRGIMLSHGMIWLDYDGKLIAVNYQSKYEERKKSELIRLDKSRLHESVKDFEKPVKILETAKYRLRIDMLGEGNYRYASWPLKSNMRDKPEVVIKNGKYIPDGTGGNHSFEFQNGEFKYVCEIIVMSHIRSAPAYLKIYKGSKEILSQKATIVTK